jgi:hypothetical protein
MATAIGPPSGNDGPPERTEQTTSFEPKRLSTFLIAIVALTSIALGLFRLGLKELGAPLIGLAVPIAAIFDKWLQSRKKGNEMPAAQRGRLGPRRTIAAAWTIAYALGYLTPTTAAWLSYPVIDVRLNHSGMVNPSEVVEVTWARLPRGWSPEIFVYSVQLKLYFPQQCGLPPSKQGRQECSIRFGLGAAGHEYEIVTATLDETARQELIDYSHNPISQGLQWLPPTATRIGALRVHN